ncbi:MAG: hypothetical protein M1835_000212 [Candelina submexicana]|nr:MAG: hypothetical protein M1835_000212 [Candelina submexicana]
MATVKIIVKNKSSANQQFQIFNDRPAYSTSVGEAWINVWGRSPGIGAKNGTAQFQFVEEMFAVCGMNPEPLGTGLVVSTADTQPVKLGTDKQEATDVPLITDHGGVVFDAANIKSFKKDGSFGISSGTYNMDQYKNAFCGLGRRSPFPGQQDIVPVSVWQAKPGQKYQITPKRVYYISTGSFVEGRIVDFAQLGAYATIDFTGRTETIATVELDNTLSYSAPVYSFDN